MAHIHLPDGSFTLLWVVIWWVVTGVMIAGSLYLLRRRGSLDSRQITIAAFCTAACFAVFQVSIPLFGGVHMNLTPLVGILTGPLVGSLIVLIVNILSAGIGHGGWGMVGVNTFVNIVEVVAAYGVYRGTGRFLSGTFSRAGIATLLSLVVGSVVMIGVILISGVQGTDQTMGQTLYGLSLLTGVNLGVAVIEAFVTGYIVTYIKRVRPAMMQGVE
ncbi:energy-coupling factor ABC transporter permease [Methanosphaerula subterraneus]|uniref:energy-coupling factor ABC transporter permease n=1 Tax=Methanosphaerula subterraneus TaxID=3350244 RepID=UPI003F82EAA8